MSQILASPINTDFLLPVQPVAVTLSSKADELERWWRDSRGRKLEKGPKASLSSNLRLRKLHCWLHSWGLSNESWYCLP